MADIHLFDDDFIAKLRVNAEGSSRLRAHYNMHEDFDEPVQRLVIGLCKGTYIPPHKHILKHQWEFFNVLKGTIKLIVFAEDSEVIATYILGQGGDAFAIQIPPNTLHTVVCMSDFAVMMELKQGPFISETAKYLPDWAIAEDKCEKYLMSGLFEAINVGENLNSLFN